jgi:hypothetical protein
MTYFVLNYPERNTYINNEGICLTLRDKKVYLEIETEVETGIILEIFNTKTPEFVTVYTLGEEWILLTEKRKPNDYG